MVTDDQLKLILDERDIMRVLHSYSHAYDYELIEEFVSVFTDDGIFEVISMPGGEIIHRQEGRDQLRAYIKNPMGGPLRPPYYRKHVVVDPLIEIDGDDAFVQSYFIHITATDEGPVLRSCGRYRDHLRRVDGSWRIAKRSAEVG